MPLQIGLLGLPKRVGSLLLAASLLLSPCVDAVNTADSGYKLSTSERRLVKFMLKDDMNGFVDRGDAMFKWFSEERISVEDINEAYSANQVAGDQKFYGKPILVSGSIRSINSGIGNSPYLVVSAKKALLSPQLHFKSDQDIGRIAKLSKGENISLFCVGAGSMAGTPMLKDCEFPDSYLGKELRLFEQDIDKYLAGEVPLATTRIFTRLDPKSKGPREDAEETALKVLLVPVAWARMLPPMSACFTDMEGSSCDIAVKRINYTEDRLEQTFFAILKDWGTAGVLLPPPFNKIAMEAKKP